MVDVKTKTHTFINGTDNDAEPVDDSFSDLFENDQTLATAVTTLETQAGGAASYSGVKTFNDGIKTDTIGEKTSAAGVTVDGLKIKDGGVAYPSGALTIDTDAITITGSYHIVDTAESASTDDLKTINGGIDGKILVLQSTDDARDITIKHGTGNISLANGADYTLGTTKQSITLIFNNSQSLWVELGRSTDYSIATQSDQETATSTVALVTPANQQYHPSATQGWVVFNGVGVVSIRASYNTTSVTDNGTGTWTPNLTHAFAAATFAAVGSAGRPGGNNTCFLCVNQNAAPTVSSCRVQSIADSGTAVDVEYVSVIFNGVLASA